MTDEEELELLAIAAKARAQKASRGNTSQGDGFNPMATVNEGLARGVGSMTEPVNTGVNWIARSLMGDEAPQLDTQPARSLMGSAGIQTLDGAEPETLAGQFGVGVGEAASYMLPFAGATSALARGSGATAGIAQRLLDPVVKAPVTALSAELAAGGGARVGQQVGEQQGGAAGGGIGAVAGALAGGITPYGITQGPGAQALRGLGRTVAKEAFPFTERGARVIAGQRLRGLSADPDEAIAGLGRETVGDLSPAQQTGQPGVMALENTAAARDPAFARQVETQRAASGEALGTAARDVGGDVAQARQFFNTQVSQAQEAAQRRLDALQPERRPGASAAIVREELDSAYGAAKQAEDQVWGQVQETAQVPTQSARVVLQDIVANTPRAKSHTIPQVARDLLGDDGLGPTDSVREVYGLYSQLGQIAREEAGKTTPNNTIIANATKLRQAILEDMGAVGDPTTDVGAAINRARGFSQELHEVFTQGTVGRLLGQTRAGGDAVDPSLTLEAALSSGGTRGAVGASKINRAAGFGGDGSRAQTTQGAVEDFMRSRFTDRVAPRGEIDPARADRFVQGNQEILDQFPGMRQQFEGAGQAARQAADMEAGVAGQFVRTQPGREVAQTVFARNVPDPVEAAESLYRQAAADSSGQAVDGLKGGFVDYIMGSAATGPRGAQNISGTAMRNTIRQNRNVLEQVMSDGEIARLDRIAREFEVLENASRSGTLSEMVEQKPNAVITYLTRVVAARSGAQLGAGTSGASLQAAGMASQRMQGIMQRLTGDRAEALLRDAIMDQDLMRALFQEVNTPRQAARIEGRLTEWLRGYAATEATQGMGGE